MCILLYKSTRYDLTGYISLVIKLNILNHMMILASADYSYTSVISITKPIWTNTFCMDKCLVLLHMDMDKCLVLDTFYIKDFV